MAEHVWRCGTCRTICYTEEKAVECEKIHGNTDTIKIRSMKFEQRHDYSAPTGSETYHPKELHIYNHSERPWEGYYVYERMRYVAPR